MTRHIRKVAVIGSGVMGSGIAAHLANIGIPSLLLDIVPKELTEEEKAKGLTLEDKAGTKSSKQHSDSKACETKACTTFCKKQKLHILSQAILRMTLPALKKSIGLLKSSLKI